MDAQAANLRSGHTWSVRPRTVAAIVAATFVVGVIVGRQPMLVAADTGQKAGAVPGPAAVAPDRAAERDALIRFRAAERGASAAAATEAQSLVRFRAAERAASAAIVPAAAERDALIRFRAAERAASADAATEAQSLVRFRAAERASRADGQEP